MSSEWRDQAVPCRDPECAGSAEPDGDAELRFYACDTCGFEFGYSRPETVAVSASGNCSVGIPEEIRLAHSRAMETVLAEQDRGSAPLLQIGRRPPDGTD